MRRALPVAGVLLLTVLVSGAQQKESARQPKAAPPRVVAKPGPEAGRAPANAPAPASIPRNPGPGPRINNPLNAGQRFLQMTAEEQERVMEKATPQQQERMRQAIEDYRRRPQFIRERLFRQYQILNALPPATQALISRRISAFNGKLADDRHRVVGEELLRLHHMAESERAARLSSDEFKNKYSPDEQEILKDLAESLPPNYPLGQ